MLGREVRPLRDHGKLSAMPGQELPADQETGDGNHQHAASSVTTLPSPQNCRAGKGSLTQSS